MSVQDDLKSIGLKLTREQKAQLKEVVQRLKIQRLLLERQARAIAKGKRGKLERQDRRALAKLMERRSLLNRKIFRFGGERKAPEFDPY